MIDESLIEITAKELIKDILETIEINIANIIRMSEDKDDLYLMGYCDALLTLSMTKFYKLKNFDFNNYGFTQEEIKKFNDFIDANEELFNNYRFKIIEQMSDKRMAKELQEYGINIDKAIKHWANI